MGKYDPVTPKEIAARLVDLRAKLQARQAMPSASRVHYEENIAAIRTEITRLEALAAN